MSPSARADFPEELRAAYRPVRHLGAGGMGTVFLAEEVALGRPVALELQGPGMEAHLAERLLREASTLASIEHANVVRIYSVGTSSRGPYLVMEFLDGSPLHQVCRPVNLIQERRATPAADWFGWGASLYVALEGVLPVTTEVARVVRAAPAPDDEAVPDTLEEAERRTLLKTLCSTGWNKKGAARKLGISHTTLFKKIRDYGLTPDEDRASVPTRRKSRAKGHCFTSR